MARYGRKNHISLRPYLISWERTCGKAALKGILFLLGKTERRGKEAVQRRSCKSTGTEDCKDLTILFVPLFENVAKEQSEENGKAVEGVAHQNTSSKQDADLPMPKDPLNDCARNRPDEQPLCDLGGGSRRDR